MNIIELNKRPDFSNDNKLDKIYIQFNQLLSELRKRDLKPGVEAFINESLAAINIAILSSSQLAKLMKQKQNAILKMVEKEHKIVPQNYYRTLWMVVGMSSIGLPFGVAFGLSMGNIGLMGLGLPIGMAIGFAIGMRLDKKALAENRQLPLEIKH